MKEATFAERATARIHLRAASALGRNARTHGKPFVQNRGELRVGDDFRLVSVPVQSHLVVARGARLVIGKDVAIGSGAAISCAHEITIGDGVRIGRAVVVMDSDFHDAEAMASPGASAAIVIGAGARIGDEVVILKGARIGEGARIADASVVSGPIPAGAFASGVPARVRRESAARTSASLSFEGRSPSSSADPRRAPLRSVSLDVEARIHAIVADTFELDRAPDPSDGPATIARWDSLGALRLLLALEEELGVRLAENALTNVANVGELAAVVTAALDV